MSSDTMVRGDTGASVKATRFGDWGRGFGDERAAGEAGGMPSEKATRFGDFTECSSEPSETSEMWLRRLEETLRASAAAGPPRGASRRGALIESGAAGPPSGATFVCFLKIRCHLCGNQTVSQPERHRADARMRHR